MKLRSPTGSDLPDSDDCLVPPLEGTPLALVRPVGEVVGLGLFAWRQAALQANGIEFAGSA